MNEAQWVSLMVKRVRALPTFRSRRWQVVSGHRLAYGYEISAYTRDGEPVARTTSFETDLAILERARDGTYWPRVVIEAKIRSVSTHDAITYSAKAAAHRSVHPYLRYGIMLGKRDDYPLPGRLYSHGSMFDFMISFRGFLPSPSEFRRFARILRSEVRASQTLQKIRFDSRKKGRDRYVVLHRKLVVQRAAA